MRIRFAYNMLLTVIAGFLVVATQAFLPVTVAWLSFAVGAAAVLLGAGAIALPTGMIQRILGAAALAIGAWTVVMSLVFAPTTVVWLGFASALALVALGITGLVAHELKTERVVHSLAVERSPLTTERVGQPISA